MLKSLALKIAIICPLTLLIGVGCSETDKRTGISLSREFNDSKVTAANALNSKTKDLQAYNIISSNEEINDILAPVTSTAPGIELSKIDGDYELKNIVADIEILREENAFRMLMIHAVKDRRSMVDNKFTGKVIGDQLNTSTDVKIITNTQRFPRDEADAKLATFTINIPLKLALDKENIEEGAKGNDFIAYSLENEEGAGFAYTAVSHPDATFSISSIFNSLYTGSTVNNEEGFINGSFREKFAMSCTDDSNCPDDSIRSVGANCPADTICSEYTVAIQRVKNDIIITAVIISTDNETVRKTIKLVYSGNAYKVKTKPRSRTRQDRATSNEVSGNLINEN